MRAFAIALTALVLSACSGEADTPSADSQADGLRPSPSSAPAQPAARGPFGISPTTSLGTLKNLGAKATERIGYYTLATPPKPHDMFESVLVQAYPETGACFIKGLGKNFPSDGHGVQVRAEMERLAGQLSAKYGEPATRVDRPMADSIWEDPQYYMMGLLKQERHVNQHWIKPAKPGPQWEGIKEIFIAPTALDDEEAYLVVEYYLDNYARCEAAGRKAEADSL